MLGRLRMTIPECITAYTELSETIFKPKQSWASPFKAVEYLNGDGKFDSQALEKQIKTQIRKSKVAENDQILLKDTKSPCKVCVFALQEEDSTLAILRTYDYPNASHTLFEECKVWEACRATSAAPTFFDPIQMGPYKQSFIDGGLRYNNPIVKVYGEAQEIWPDRTIVATSIGTGEAPGTKFACLESLAFMGMNSRKGDIVDGKDDTCGWLLENKNYARWIQNDDGLLWIQGKAGAGKSTLMKYIYGKIQTPTVDVPGLQLSFFFHARGIELQKTPLGMFRSLLLQLYKGDPTAHAGIKKEFNKNSEDGMVGVKWEWTERMLEKLFTNLICQISRTTKVTIFVDALDEAGEVAKDLVTYLANLYEEVQQKNGTVKICFSSRLYPILPEKVAEDQKVVVDHENTRGIQSFIRKKFEKELRDDGPIKSEKANLELEGDIAEKADGVFQWVCLVWAIIFDADLVERPLDWIKRKLDELPKDLDDMYRYILEGLIGQGQQREVLKLFRWVCFAARPLSLEEIRHAMAVVDSLPPLRVYNLKDSIEYVEHDMKRRITALSGGLIEVRAHSSGTVVQVSHQTVREFLLKTGFEILTGLKGSCTEKQQLEGSCHDILARSCINYLWTEDVQQHSTVTGIKGSSSKRTWIQLPSLETLPLLQYAIVAFFWHASRAEKNGYPQKTLLQQFDYQYTYRYIQEDIVEQGLFSLWCSAARVFCPRDYFGVLPLENCTLLHIASMANIPTVVDILFEKGVKVAEKDERGQQAIHYAARGGATDVCEILIKFSSSVINAKDNNSVTPLQMAARNNRVSVMRLLIMKGATIKCLNEDNTAKLTEARGDVEKTVSLLLEDATTFNAQSLQSAAANGDLRAVQLLLAEGTDVNTNGGHYRYALVAAAHNGHDDVAMALLQKGAEINAQGGMYGCALVAAAHNGDENMITMLLSMGAEINARGGDYAIALAAAAYLGHLALVNTLLDKGAEVNARGGKYGNALAAASSSGYEEVVKILLERGAKINAQSGEFGNALAAAAYNGHREMVSVLLKRGANINTQSGIYGNALMAALDNEKDAVAMLLLGEGAETNAPSGKYVNALALAGRNSRVAMVHALLNAKAECDPYLATVDNLADFDGDGILSSLEVVLLVASLVGRLDVVEGILAFNGQGHQSRNVSILSHGRLNGEEKDMETTQYYGYTALQLAAAGGHPKVVVRLLSAGANAEDAPNDDGGRRALQAAAGSGNLEIVEILVNYGADVNAPASKTDGRTALQAAAEHGHLEIVERLLAIGANVNGTNRSERCGSTALGAAALNGHLEVVAKLIAAKADVNLAGPTAYANTALEGAASWGHFDVVDILLAAGAENAPSHILRFGTATALQEAVEHGYDKIAGRLLASGADLSVTGSRYVRRTPLSEAVRNGDVEAVTMLLKARANVEATSLQDGVGRTPLFEAALAGYVEVAAMLIVAGAYVNSDLAGEYDRNGTQRSVIPHLSINGFQPSTLSGYRPLNAAIDNGHLEMADLLRKAGARLYERY
ncbi:hypothetical protein ACLOAV_005116 [Pseudogymnoascus australis]